MNKIYLFVYGTLKTGNFNNRLLNGFKGIPAKAPGILLFEGPGYPFAKRGSGTAIGELYEIDEKTLARIDRLEGHPEYYHREKTKVLAGKKKEEAWIYLIDRPVRRVIVGGEWKKLLL